MIKINLRKNQKQGKSQGKDKGKTVPQSVQLESDEVKKEAFRKILIIIVFPICLMIYESLVVPDQETTYREELKKLKTVTDFNTQNNQVAEAIKKMQNTENVMALKIAEIEKKVSDKNTRIEMLDILQQLVPEKVWLTQMTDRDSLVTLSGFAVSDLELNQFFEAISKSIVFKDANINKSNEAVQDGVALKKFEIAFKLGGKHE